MSDPNKQTLIDLYEILIVKNLTLPVPIPDAEKKLS